MSVIKHPTDVPLDDELDAPPKASTPSPVFLWLEWSVLFLGFPLLAFMEWFEVRPFFLFVLPVVYALVLEWPHFRRPQIIPRPGGGFLARMGIVVVALFVGAWWWMPERFLFLPREMPGLWLMILVLYPLISVLPQEILYRQFYFRRYAALWPREMGLVASNIVLFAWLHIMYDNGVAIGFSLIGGALFSVTYQRTRCLWWAWLEHTVYGLAVFTSGWGHFFYEGPVRG